MNKFDSRKTLNIVLSVLAALLIWIYVGNVDDSEITARAKDVPIVYAGEEGALANRGLMLVSGSVDTVDLKLRAKRNILYHLDTKDLKAVVDLSGITATGTYTLYYNLDFPNNVQKSRVTVDSASVYSVNVTIGELYKKTVDLKYEVDGEVAPGYLAQPIKTEVDTLDIHGQQSDVIRVSYAKVSYDLEGAAASVNEMVNFAFYDSANRLIEGVKIYANHDQVPLSIPVYKIRTTALKASVKDVAGLRAEDVVVTVQPQQLKIAGESYLVDDMEELTVTEVDLAAIGGGVSKTVRLQLPQGVISVDGVREVTVSITVQSGIASKTIETMTFSTVNVPEGMGAEVLSEVVPVTLRGKIPALESADPGKIVVTADLAGISVPGTYSVPAVVTYIGEEDLGVLGSYELDVQLWSLEETDPNP